jgi:hypothetical protein
MPTPTPTLPPTLTYTPTATVTPTLTPTPTPPPPLAVLLADQEADQTQVSAWQTALHAQITEAGLRWQVRQRLDTEDLTPELRLVIALPPDPGVAALAAAAPQTQFLAVNIPDVQVAANLSTIGAQGARPDQEGFIAGVIAAMITPDWRVGVIGVSDTVEGQAAKNGFLNGVEYFCGLCNPAHSPIGLAYDYPLYVELPSNAMSIEWQTAASYLIDHVTQTIYLTPGMNDEATLNYLAEAGADLIGYGTPSEALRPHWIASMNSDLLPVVQELIPELLQGQGGQELPLPLVLSNINTDVFSPGKQNLASQTLQDLLAGYIDTGVDLATGESK